jgi:hypothetical protein
MVWTLWLPTCCGLTCEEAKCQLEEAMALFFLPYYCREYILQDALEKVRLSEKGS